MAGFTRNVAIVIGIDAYSRGIPPLRTAVADASSVARKLEERHGYTVTLLTDAGVTCDTLRAALSVMLSADDRLLIYFAGHGVALDGDNGPEGFLLLHDARAGAPKTFFGMTELHALLAQLECRHLLVVLDCCFAGAFRWSSTRHFAIVPEVMYAERYERFIRDAAWQVLASAACDQKALDVVDGRALGVRGEQDRHSPFAAALLAALDGAADRPSPSPAAGGRGDGVITATELYLYLRDCVETVAAGQHQQTPSLWPLPKHDKGEYVFLTPGAELLLDPAPELNRESNPFRGLESFEQKHAKFFFGRQRVSAALCAQVETQPLTLVLGGSGSGKSSLVKAGLLPALPPEWEIVATRPGKSPLLALKSLPLPKTDAPLAERVGAWLAASPGRRLLLFIDQLEELVTLASGQAEAEALAFLGELAATLSAHRARLRIVATLRSDFAPQFAGRALARWWNAARFLIPPLSQNELREAIEGPAAASVLYYEPASLVETLINEVAQTPSALPLLSFTLSELYLKYLARRASDRALTQEDYDQLGGVAGSLRHRATAEYEDLDEAHRGTMRRVLLRMVSLEGGELARRRVPRPELQFADAKENERVTAVLARLTVARLLVHDVEPDGTEVVEPAHDALVRGWDLLLAWSREAQEEIQLRRLLTPAAVDFATTGDEGALWNENPRLPLLRRVEKSPGHWLNAIEHSFVLRSWRRQLRKRWQIGLSIAAGLLAVGWGGWSAWKAIEAGRDAAQKTRLAQAETFARIATSQPSGAYDVPVQIAAIARQRYDSATTTGALHRALMRQPLLNRTLRVFGAGNFTVVLGWNGDGSLLACATSDSIAIADRAGQPPAGWPTSRMKMNGQGLGAGWQRTENILLAAYLPEDAARKEVVLITMSPQGLQEKSLKPPPSPEPERIQKAIFSPEGNFVALIGWQSLHLHRLGDGQSARLPIGFPIQSLTWHPDGRRIAIVGDRRGVALWKVGPDGEPLAASETWKDVAEDDAGVTDSFIVAKWGANGTSEVIACGGRAQDIQLVNFSAAAKTTRLDAKGVFNDLAWSPVGDALAAVFDGKALVWEGDDWTKSPQTVELKDNGVLAENATKAVAWSHDGRFLAAATDHGAAIWSARERGATAQFLPDRECPNLLWSPVEPLLAAGSSEGLVYLGHAHGGPLAIRWPLRSAALSHPPAQVSSERSPSTRASPPVKETPLAWIPGTTRLSIAEPQGLMILDAATRSVVSTGAWPPGWVGAHKSLCAEDGLIVLLDAAPSPQRSGGYPMLWTLLNGTVAGRLVAAEGRWRRMEDMAWWRQRGSSPATAEWRAVWRDRDEIWTWLTPSAEVVADAAPVKWAKGVKGLAASGERIALLRSAEVELRENSEAAARLVRLPGELKCDRVLLSPNGETVVLVGQMASPQRLAWLDFATGELKAVPLDAVSGFVVAASFSPDGRYLALGGVGELTIMELPSRKTVFSAAVQASPVSLLEWSADSAFLATGSRDLSGDRDPTIRVWRIADRSSLLALGSDQRTVLERLVWSKTGHWLAAIWSDRPWIHLWNLDPASWTIHARNTVGFALDPEYWKRATGESQPPPNLFDAPEGVITGIVVEEEITE